MAILPSFLAPPAETALACPETGAETEACDGDEDCAAATGIGETVIRELDIGAPAMAGDSRLSSVAGPRSESAAIALPLSVSRFSLCKSARISDACWYRRFRSFSNALLIRASSLDGKSGFRRTGETGARSRIAWKISAEVSPRKGSMPVDISYSTTPTEKR